MDKGKSVKSTKKSVGMPQKPQRQTTMPIVMWITNF